MPLPLSFTGALTDLGNSSSADELTKRIALALASEGGSDIRTWDHCISFHGLTNYLSLSQLANVTDGVIELDDRSSSLGLTYAIRVDRTPFVASCVIAVVGLVFMVVGVTQFGFFAAFGLGVLVLSTAFSFVMRFRLHRWLRGISEQLTLDSG
jgi:hypothetical protein